MAFDLKGRVALVTGSSTGLGKGIAFALGNAGARVAINYANNCERAEKGFAEYQAAGLDGLLVQGSAINASDLTRVNREIRSKLGPVDIVVANATPDQPQLPIEEYDADFYRSMLEYFVMSPYLLAREFLPSMKEKKWGRIVNVSSEVFQCSVGNFSAYVAAKGGQNGWTRSMATELAPFGITVNLVAPGWIPTERHLNDPQEAKDSYLGTIPAGRWGTPEDVGNAVVYYASDEASFISGQSLCVNGGRTPW